MCVVVWLVVVYFNIIGVVAIVEVCCGLIHIKICCTCHDVPKLSFEVWVLQRLILLLMWPIVYFHVCVECTICNYGCMCVCMYVRTCMYVCMYVSIFSFPRCMKLKYILKMAIIIYQYKTLLSGCVLRKTSTTQIM